MLSKKVFFSSFFICFLEDAATLMQVTQFLFQIKFSIEKLRKLR